MVCSIDHLASSTGVAVLRRGGSAADAAIAANAVLTVTAPDMCGMGGDLFALVHDGSATPATLNASGRIGSGADAAGLRAEGHRRPPHHGDVRSAPVPGCVDGWLALHARFGRLPLADLLAPAQAYAVEGFAASPRLASLAPLVAEADWTSRGPGAVPTRRGRVRRPDAARALAAVVAQGRDGFYGGEFGEALLALGGGLYDPADLEAPLADWVEPLSAEVFAHRLWTVPPNSQGYLTLAGALVAEAVGLPEDEGVEWAHLLIESAIAAAHDRPAVLHEDADGEALLAQDRLAPRAAALSRTGTAGLGAPADQGDTMYLCAIDRDRLGVSLIQSNAAAFGSRLVVPGTGIFLHNRAVSCSLAPGHPAEYRPGIRPPHTLAPLLVTRPNGSLRAVLGTMGGDSQPQVLLQLLARWLHHGRSPGRAVGAPRWVLGRHRGEGFDTWTDPSPLEVRLERDAADDWARGLTALGHRVVLRDELDLGMGHAHLLEVQDDGLLAGSSDPRASTGAAQGY